MEKLHLSCIVPIFHEKIALGFSKQVTKGVTLKMV